MLGIFEAAKELLFGKSEIKDSTQGNFIGELIIILKSQTNIGTESYKEKYDFAEAQWKAFLGIRYELHNHNYSSIPIIKELLTFEACIRKLFAEYLIIVVLNVIKPIGGTIDKARLGAAEKKADELILKKMKPLFEAVNKESIILKESVITEALMQDYIHNSEAYLDAGYINMRLSAANPNSRRFVAEMKLVISMMKSALEKELSL